MESIFGRVRKLCGLPETLNNLPKNEDATGTISEIGIKLAVSRAGILTDEGANGGGKESANTGLASGSEISWGKQTPRP